MLELSKDAGDEKALGVQLAKVTKARRICGLVFKEAFCPQYFQALSPILANYLKADRDQQLVLDTIEVCCCQRLDIVNQKHGNYCGHLIFAHHRTTVWPTSSTDI